MSRRWILSTPDTIFWFCSRDEEEVNSIHPWHCILILFQRWVGGEFYPPLTLYFDSVPEMSRRWILSTPDTVFWFCSRDEEEVNSIHPSHCILMYLPEMSRRWILSTPDTVFDCIFQRWWVGGEFYPPLTLYFDSVPEMSRRWILSTPNTVFVCIFQRWVGGEFYPSLTLYFVSVPEMSRRWILSTPDTVFWFCFRD